MSHGLCHIEKAFAFECGGVFKQLEKKRKHVMERMKRGAFGGNND